MDEPSMTIGQGLTIPETNLPQRMAGALPLGTFAKFGFGGQQVAVVKVERVRRTAIQEAIAGHRITRYRLGARLIPQHGEPDVAVSSELGATSPASEIGLVLRRSDPSPICTAKGSRKPCGRSRLRSTAH
jgi:hypothetical protein